MEDSEDRRTPSKDWGGGLSRDSLATRRGKLAVVAGAVFLYWVYVSVDQRQVSDILLSADPALVALSFVSVLLGLVLRGYVWYRFLSVVDDRVSVAHVYLTFLVGLSVKKVLPPVADTAAVAYPIHRVSESGYGSAVAQSISIDVFVRVLPLIFFAVVGLPVYLLSDVAEGRLLFIASVLLLLLATVLFYAASFSYRPHTRRLLVYIIATFGSIIAALPKTEDTGIQRRTGRKSAKKGVRQAFITLDSIFESDRTLTIGFVCGLFAWVFLALPLYLLLIAVNEPQSVSLVFTVVVLSHLGVTVAPETGPTPVLAVALSTIADVDASVAVAVTAFYYLQVRWLPTASGVLSGVILLGSPNKAQRPSTNESGGQ